MSDLYYRILDDGLDALVILCLYLLHPICALIYVYLELKKGYRDE